MSNTLDAGSVGGLVATQMFMVVVSLMLLPLLPLLLLLLPLSILSNTNINSDNNNDMDDSGTQWWLITVAILV